MKAFVSLLSIVLLAAFDYNKDVLKYREDCSCRKSIFTEKGVNAKLDEGTTGFWLFKIES